MTVQAIGLSKTFGKKLAVSNLSFTLEPGAVTGFVGPNGAGKSTTMRLMLGLDHGEGQTLWDGRELKDHAHVTEVVGTHLDSRFFNPNRTARAHLRMIAAEAKVPDRRVDEVLDLVGLSSEAKKRPKTFSLGMGQRLGLAGAILAKPRVLLLDEPANGLDPQSIQWLRDFLKFYAEAGNVVFVSSHLLSEMQHMAEKIVVISKGAIIANEDVDSFISRSTKISVIVRTPKSREFVAALKAEGVTASIEQDGAISIESNEPARVGDLAFRSQVPIHELSLRVPSLEQAFFEMTADGQQYATGGAA